MFKKLLVKFFCVFLQILSPHHFLTCTNAESCICFFISVLLTSVLSQLNSGVMSLLRPLLLDVVPTIQQTAALALGRLANYNDDLAEAVVKGDILPQLVYSLAEQNVRPKKKKISYTCIFLIKKIY